MMKSLHASLCLAAWMLLTVCATTAQTPTQTVTLEGLRLMGHQGAFKAAQYTSDGGLVLLYDQGDGVRLLKTDAAGGTLAASARIGAAGDSGVAMALDPAGNIYIVGTSTSGSLAGTAGVAFPQAADTSTNSFLARFDPGLNLSFISFLGAGKTAVTGISATTDAVFITGSTYSEAFPTTAAAMQQKPASGSDANGFVERFSTTGDQLVYATYLTGTGGDTNPSAIAADATDSAYVTGQTSSTSFPVLAALDPVMRDSTAGFLTKLSPAGDNVVFSTYVPGTGLTGLALDTATNSLLLGGNVAMGEFPVATVAAPIAGTPYQTLLRLGMDGQTVAASVLLAPGTSSAVSAGASGTAWLGGTLTAPLLATASGLGDSFLLKIGQDGDVSSVNRFGGFPTADREYASLTSLVTAAPAVSADGTVATLAMTLTGEASPSLAAAEPFDLPLVAAVTAVLPNLPTDLLPTSCAGLSQCRGTAGLLASVSTGSPASLSLSVGDVPNLILRNSGGEVAENLAMTAAGFTLTNDCGSTLSPGQQCDITVSGAGPGSITISASNATPLTVPLPASTGTLQALALSTAELNFGIVTASNSPVLRSFTVSNLSSSPQSFASVGDGIPASAPFGLNEAASTCPGTPSAHNLPAHGSCTVTLGLTAFEEGSKDGPVQAGWRVGARDVAVSGFTQAADLSLSSSTIDFGVRYSGTTPALPRYLYLSNSSGSPIAHTAIALPPTSAFAVTDNCPSTLEPASVWQLAFPSAPATVPSADSATLNLDAGLSVVLAGEVLSLPENSAQSVLPSLLVSPASLTFGDPVVVTQTSSQTSVVTLTNSGESSLPIQPAITGDFQLSRACPAALAPGASCSLLVGFTPSAPGLRDGLLTLGSNAGAAGITVPLTGFASPLLPANNGILDLGATPVGEPTFAWYNIQAAVPSLTVATTGSNFLVAVVGEDGNGHGSPPVSAFSTSVTATCGSCWLGIAFVPQSAGQTSAVLTLSTAPGGAAYVVSLKGQGIPTTGLVLTPSAPGFGTVPVGSVSAPVTLTLGNLLNPAVAANVQNVSASGDFHVLATQVGTTACSGTLAATASCSVTLSFAPTATGTRAGMLTVVTDQGTVTLPLSGDGVPDTGLSISPTELTFSSPTSPAATPTPTLVTLTNTSPSQMAIGALQTTAPSFTAASSCSVLQPAASCVVTVDFAPGASQVTATLEIPVTSSLNGQPATVIYTVPLAGSYTSNGVGLLLSPSQVDFGAGATGILRQTRQFAITNTSAGPQSFSLNVPRHFPLASPFGCASLAAGQSCTFSVSFLPESGGPLTGSLLLTATSATGVNTEAIGYLLGYGEAVGKLTISNDADAGAPVDFGLVASGATGQQTLTLTNSGAGPLTPRRIVSAPPFQAQSTCGKTLSPGAACTVTLSYRPTYQLPSGATNQPPRADANILLIESDAASSPDAVPLTGMVLPTTASGNTDAFTPASYTLSEAALTFANTQVGDISAPQTLTLANTSSALFRITGVVPSADFQSSTTCKTVLPGQTCTITVTFAPGQGTTTAPRAGAVAIQSDAVDALEFVSLLGLSTPSPLTLSPSAVKFGEVVLGQSGSATIAVSNSDPLPITFGSLTATNGFTISSGTCPTDGSTLPAGGSCTLQLTFAPTATGGYTGTLTLSSSATTSPLTIALTGTGVAPSLQAIPGSLAFGSLAVGGSTSLSLDLGNIGSAPLTGLRFSISGADAADFAISKPCPLTTYSPFSGCALAVTFLPQAAGPRSASLIILSSDPAGPLVIPLSGTGIPAGGFLLTVDGASSAALTVQLGAPASFALAVTPQNGYTGPVALTCTPLGGGASPGCSLLDPQLALTGGAASTATATITTSVEVRSGTFALWSLLLLVPTGALIFKDRKKRGPLALLIALAAGISLICIDGCGGTAAYGLAMTPPGTYIYRVTASATNGQQTSSSVTLSVTVQ